MHAKRSPTDPAIEASQAATREVDSVSLLAAELLLSRQDDSVSGQREIGAQPLSSSSWPTPSPSPPPSRASLRDSLLPDEPSRSTRTIAIVGAIVAFVLLTGGAAFLLTRGAP
jgi:hypothetical protein